MTATNDKANRRWGSLRFRVYQLAVLRYCLCFLEAFERRMNKDFKKTVEPMTRIKAMQSRLDDILGEWNLRNSWALARRRQLALTVGEWKTLQNSLCVTIGLDKAGAIKASNEFMTEVKRLHRRFELIPIRVAAGLKAQGFKVNERKLEKIVEWYRTHSPEAVFRPYKAEVAEK